MPTLAETLAAGADELAEFNALLQQYLDGLAGLAQSAVYYELWVDQFGGDNTNDGLTAATALQTIPAAVARTPPGSYVLVNLLSDYTMEGDIDTSGRVIRIRGRNASGVATQRNFIHNASGGVARRLHCIDGGAFFLSRLDIYLNKTTISSGTGAFCQGILKTLYLNDCGIDVESGVTTAAVMGPSGISILEVSTVTALDDAIAGYWVGGVSASTDPATLGKVLTNLTSL